MVELVPGFWVVSEDVKAVKVISANKCTIWVANIEPIVVNSSAEDVLRFLGVIEDDEDEDEEIFDDTGGEGDDD